MRTFVVLFNVVRLTMWWLLGIAIIAVMLIKSCAPKSKADSEKQTNNNIDLLYKSDKILNEYLFNNEVAVTHFRLCAKITSVLAKDCNETQARTVKNIQSLYEEQNKQFEDLLDKFNRESNLNINNKIKSERLQLTPLNVTVKYSSLSLTF